jgi:hypothetical protein
VVHRSPETAPRSGRWLRAVTRPLWGHELEVESASMSGTVQGFSLGSARPDCLRAKAVGHGLVAWAYDVALGTPSRSRDCEFPMASTGRL